MGPQYTWPSHRVFCLQNSTTAEWDLRIPGQVTHELLIDIFIQYKIISVTQSLQ